MGAMNRFRGSNNKNDEEDKDNEEMSDEIEHQGLSNHRGNGGEQRDASSGRSKAVVTRQRRNSCPNIALVL